MKTPSIDELISLIPRTWNGFILRIQWEQTNYKNKEGHWHVGYWELGHEDETRGESFTNCDLSKALYSLREWLKKEDVVNETYS